jgi:hypothetical protein
MPLIWRALSGARAQITLARSRGLDAKTTAATSGGNSDSPNLLPILEVFLAALEMRATDQRDKLFALLVFGRETCIAIPPALRPDYTKPLPNTRADFTRWCIQQARSLDVLSFIHCHPARAWQRTLGDQATQTELAIAQPTWAMETEGFSTWLSMTLLGQFPRFRASGDTVPDENLLLQDAGTLVLRLRGYQLGSVIALAHPPQSLLDPSTETRASQPAPNLHTVFHHMFDTSGRTGLWSFPGVKDKQDLNWGPIPEYIFPDHVRAHTRYLPATNTPQYAILPAAGTSGQYERFRQDGALPACIDECFFIASDGSSGLCPWTVREGDVIALLHGGTVPYVLRPVPPLDDEDEHLVTYQLVGECFVDRANVMDGGFITGEMETQNEEPLAFVIV